MSEACLALAASGVEMKYMGGPSRRTKPEMAAVVLHL